MNIWHNVKNKIKIQSPLSSQSRLSKVIFFSRIVNKLMEISRGLIGKIQLKWKVCHMKMRTLQSILLHAHTKKTATVKNGFSKPKKKKNHKYGITAEYKYFRRK